MNLITVLYEYGDIKMAEDYLNCRSEKLTDGAHRWVAAHGYRIETDLGSSPLLLGAFLASFSRTVRLVPAF